MNISETYNIDCLEYMRTISDKYFDVAIVDPPYGGGSNENKYKGSIDGRFGGRFEKYIFANRTGGTWAAKYGKNIAKWDIAPNKEYFNELFRVSKNQIIFGGNYFQLPPTRCFIVWRKPTISENFTMAMAEYAWTSFNGNSKVYDCSPQGKSNDTRFHPTQKPIELYAWVIRNFCKQGDKIFDSHLGSGSSRIAAYKLGFDFVGCEIDSYYYQQQQKRFDRECLNTIQTENGQKLVQLGLF